MWVCKDCFADEEMGKEVENNSTDKGICDVCGKNGKRCDISVFTDFFVSVIHLFKADINSHDTIISILEKDWKIFTCKKQVFDQQFSEKLVSADFGKQLLHILIDKAVMRQRAAASLLGA